MRYLILFLTVALISCGSSEKSLISISEEESSAVGKVLEFYDGECHRSIGFESKNGVKEKYFELSMKKSQLIEQYAGMEEMPASNIAHIFYSNLKKDKSKYTHVRVSIERNKAEVFTKSFQVEQLELIDQYLPMLDKVTKGIREEDYESLIQLFDADRLESVTAEILKEYCGSYDEVYGLPIRSQINGFKALKDDKLGKELIYLIGALEREKQNSPIVLVLNAENGKVLRFLFENGL